MKKMNNKGFSLVELIIVIAIMAILAGALAPALISYVAKSRRSTTVSNAQTIASGVDAALSDEEAYDDATAVFKDASAAKPVHVPDTVPAASGNAFWGKVNENVSGGLKAYSKLKATKTSKKASTNATAAIDSDAGYYMYVDTETSSIIISIKLADGKDESGATKSGAYVQVYPNAEECMTK